MHSFPTTSLSCSQASSSRTTTQPTAQGLFILLSRFNHSCIPNASMRMGKGDSISCVAIKDIRPDEEITFCYYGHSNTSSVTRAINPSISSEIAKRAFQESPSTKLVKCDTNCCEDFSISSWAWIWVKRIRTHHLESS